MKFTVYGRPQPQGSTRAFVVKGRTVTTSANKNLAFWRQQVTDTAFVESGCMPYSGDGSEAVTVRVVFFFNKPKSANKRQFPTVRPDIDKCVRAILDSLTGIAYRDDAQVVEVHAQKRYGGPIERVEIEVLS